MPTPILGAAITGGASLVGGLMGKKKTATQVSTPQFTAGQTQLQDQTQKALSDRIANPKAVLDPLKVQALDQNNQAFDGANERLSQALSARGFGQSGKMATGFRSNEIARAGSAGKIDSTFAGLEADQQNKTLDQALKFSFAGAGSRTASTGPSNVLGGAAAGGAQTATFLYALNHMLSGGGMGDGKEGPEYSNSVGDLGGTYQEGDDI